MVRPFPRRVRARVVSGDFSDEVVLAVPSKFENEPDDYAAWIREEARDDEFLPVNGRDEWVRRGDIVKVFMTGDPDSLD